MIVRGLLAVLSLAAPAVAQDRCIVACDVVTEGADAAARVEAVLGIPVPPEAEVVGLVEGGFQDAFAQARFEADGPALDALLAAIGAKRGDLTLRDDPYASPYAGDDGPSWWDVTGTRKILGAEGALPGYAYTTLLARPPRGERARWTVYLWAFQT